MAPFKPSPNAVNGQVKDFTGLRIVLAMEEASPTVLNLNPLARWVVSRVITERVDVDVPAPKERALALILERVGLPFWYATAILCSSSDDGAQRLLQGREVRALGIPSAAADLDPACGNSSRCDKAKQKIERKSRETHAGSR